ncbi:N-acetylmuramate alpha-1-phosphate uridylyltransferase MurU [Lysobacter niastensis]|uniref:Nucleotidyltransferase family protein n=1 Tax=Lysobacter niastensis TaxID=380629 RepID=A0ABS0B2W9_9GAMM|nr:nucleotidyltransferase family protein [Lysobacter niastensis]MBF6022673.1 nucleotidyltransferase family protein [Lysobacter niastensis]
MKALIFAAGLGERMRPLTDTTPKPLLEVAGKPLIVWHLEKLAAIGIRDIVINTSWLAPQFPQTLGDGARWGLRLHYSYEGTQPLETGGGMLHALPLLGESPFLLVNGDIWTDYDFARLPREPAGLAHLVMVDRPVQATQGDFALDDGGLVRGDGPHRLTYAGLGIYRPQLLDGWRAHSSDAGADATPPRFRLAPILRAHMEEHRISGEHHRGQWTDVGTPQRLQALNESLASGIA